MFGGGLRLLELVKIRIHDIDFVQNLLLTRSGKGDKDRTILLPASLIDSLQL